MEVVELFQDEVQFPYGVIRRVSAALFGTLFFSSSYSISVDQCTLLYNVILTMWLAFRVKRFHFLFIA